ncbi:MAG TPA: hypothetical protein VHE99_04670 [Gammaproteobacteria bacterium]|nr:hypothetical protein [Gammaproteobacteria bacterium]
MFNFATQPQSIVRIFSDSTRLYKTTFLKIWLWQLLWQIPLLILSLLDDNSPIAHQLNLPNGTFFSIAGAILALACVLVPLFGCLFNFHRIYNLVTPPYLTSRASLKIALKKLLPAIGATLLIFIIPTLLWGLVIGVEILLKFISIPLLIILMIVVGIPLLFATLFFFFLVGYYQLAMVLDNCSAVKSIKASCKLVWGHWWRNFFVLLVFSIIQALVTLLALMLTSFLFSSLPTLGLVIGMIMVATISLWGFSVLLVQFNDLKLRQQRKSLQVAPA